MTDIRVWVGCLACYNNGRLIGEWVDAVDAGDYACPSGRETHEEYWVMDSEIPGVHEEMSPDTAVLWGELWATVEEHHHEAFAAWLSCYGIRNPEDATVEAFEDAYEGEWESPEAHAWNWVEETTPHGEEAKAPAYFMFAFDAVAWNCDHTWVDGHVFNDHALRRQ